MCFWLTNVICVFDFRDTKMNLLRPIAEDLTLLDEQRREWEAKLAQVNQKRNFLCC